MEKLLSVCCDDSLFMPFWNRKACASEEARVRVTECTVGVSLGLQMSAQCGQAQCCSQEVAGNGESK